MSGISRRYDIDWLRVIAIGLLLIYHSAISFQPWGIMLGFISKEKPWESLWTPMAMLNVWRIPLLFFVSGMGVYFAMQQRTWKQLLIERTLRILVPFLFGMLVIVPVGLMIWQYYHSWDIDYSPNPGHLWFLMNIFVYVVVLMPLFYYLKRNENGRAVVCIKKILSAPLALLLVMATFLAEAWLVDPNPFELYATTWHGFFIGLVAFFWGFIFVLAGEGFWQMMLRWRWAFVVLAISLFALRLFNYNLRAPVYLVSIESNGWIFSVLAFGHRYLNRPGEVLQYLSQAAYPVYILHLVFMNLACMLIFPLPVPDGVQFPMVLALTFAGCFASYELIRRAIFLRPLFGLKVR